MRITRVSIGSFGALRDRTYDVSPGMTVFHGPNESGKTTVMEFIRSAMVPTRKRTYPARSKGDSGTLAFDDSGGHNIMRIEGRDRAGDVPDLPAGVGDPDLYRSVFAMDQRGLDDEGAVGGEIRSRFLTVPGGEAMPAARGWAEKEISDVMGRRSNSPSRVLGLSSEAESNRAALAEARRDVDAYGDLASRRDSLEEELEGLREASSASMEDKRVHDLYEAQRANYDALSHLGASLAGLGTFREVTDADRAELARLQGDLSAKEAARRALEDQRGSMDRDLMGADRRRVASCAGRIDQLPGRLESYRDDVRRLSLIPVGDQRRTVESRVRRMNPLVYIGAVLAIAGLVGAMFSLYTLALTAVGAVIAAVGVSRPQYRTVVTDVAGPDPGLAETCDRLEASVRDFESDVSSLMADVGLVSRGPEADVATLVAVRDASASIGRTETDLMKAKLAHTEAEASMARFVSGFGGPDGFEECSRRTAEAAGLRSRISTIRRAIEASGLDPDLPECPVEYRGFGTEDIERVSRELGETERSMRAILDADGVERLMDRAVELDSEMSSALVDGAVALLALSIADDACEDIYSTVQPGVISTADRYLGMMTGGRYSIDTNPMTKDLSVRSGDTVKDIGMWSSGLRAQVLLSVKLAVAREMGGGEVPVILDDVLLPFDSERKAGACRALAEVSSEMQVLMFTCDSETASICRGIPGVEVVDMA